MPQSLMMRALTINPKAVAIRAMKQGAFDFLQKPYSDDELLACIKGALALGREIDRSEHEKRGEVEEPLGDDGTTPQFQREDIAHRQETA